MRRRLPVPVLELLGLVGVLAALVAGFSLTTERFFTALTLRTIANQVPEAVIVAVGLTFVLVVAGIDLSVGSVLALSSAVLGVSMLRLELGLLPAALLALVTGLACGILNGLLSVRLALPSFIVTLGTLEMARGGTYLVTRSQTQYVGSAVEGLAETSLLGLSLPFLGALALVAAGQFVLSRTVFGRYAAAIGTNEEAVRLSGIDPRPVKTAVFAISGLCAGLAGIVYTSRLASADPNAAVGFELQAIAAVVVGGTSLMGGRGSVVGSFLGVLIIAVLGSGLAQVGAQEPTKRLVTGAVIVAAVVIDHFRRRAEKGVHSALGSEEV
jgi:ribose transport system permease protein